MAEWPKDHVVAIRSLKTKHFGLLAKIWLNGDRTGPLGESGDSWLGMSGSGYVASQNLQGCSPRLCRLRTVRLAPVSKYWTYRSHAGDMGPVSLIVGCQQELDFSPLLFGCCGREAGYGLTDRTTVILWIVSGALLLRCSGSVQICWQLYERLLYMDHVRYVWSWTIRGLSVESVWRVGWVFTCRVYIDLNHRDSRIWVTACLWQSSHS
jgi:hypothetical protein